jgi:hypothetical protein
MISATASMKAPVSASVTGNDNAIRPRRRGSQESVPQYDANATGNAPAML